MIAKHLVPFSELIARVQCDPARKDSLIGLLPVLEHGHLEAQAFENVEALRLTDLVTFAVKEGSAYWAGLALSWLEAGFPIPVSLRSELLLVSQRSTLDQSLRHRAYALHRKIA